MLGALSKRLPILLGLVLAACGDPPKKAPVDIPVFCQPTAQLTLLEEPELYQHSKTTLHAVARVLSCDGGSAVAVDVNARVNGPDGGSVPVALKVTQEPFVDLDGGLSFVFGGFELDGGALVRAEMSFDTDDLGLYHFMLTFKPGLGNLQGQLVAMVDRRAQGPKGVTTPDTTCNNFDLWDDTAVCQATANASNDLVVLREGQAISRHQNDAFLVSDAGLWTVENTPNATVSLWKLDGPGVALAARGVVPVEFEKWGVGQGPAMASAGDSLLLFANSELMLAHRNGATVTFQTVGAVPFPQGAPVAMLLREGEGAVVAEQNFAPSFPGLCVVTFADGGADCRNDRFALGADRDVLWVTSTAGEVSVIELDAGLTLVEHRTPYLQGFPAMPNFTQNVMFLQSGNFISSTLGTPFTGSGAFFVSDPVARVPVFDGSPALEGFGHWSGQSPATGATSRCFWQYDYFSQTAKYLPR
ncbi:MAG: hypothetical protein QM723_35120 [Myxococcaceae bacterium]